MNKNTNKTINRTTIIFILCFLIGALSLTLPAVQAKENIKLNTGKATLLKGEALKLKLSGYAGKVKWSSSDSKVAKVTKKGKVTAKKTGSTKITAKAGGKKYTCKVKVENPVVYTAKYMMKTGAKYQLCVTGTTLPIKWKSKDPIVAKVNSKGVVTAVSTGKTTVTAKVSKKVFKLTIEVTEGIGFSADGGLVALV